jgi:Tol biopolymer transport system component/tRNA A-37 threonylcarbamoyl transferase component Bud32
MTAPGAKLGPYEIVSLLGKGGMGEVWKARDPQLGRDVAIKVSAQEFTDRFEREARAIAALNHPNVCTLYHIGPNYLVMELIEGPTLADRIAQGPIPLEEALGIAKQIAAALEAAHEKAIVHRDLKPANVKIKPDGSVKVLDFGLATAGAEPELDSNSPTMMPGTVAGMILGTAGYMSPEQARGQKADKRADIWAFGVVLYEMLTGKRLFDGATVTDSLAAILRAEPDLTQVPERTRRLLARCLEKDPRNRLRDIGDAMALVDEPGFGHAATSRVGLSWMAAVTIPTVLLAILAFIHFRETPPVEQSLRYEIAPPGATAAEYPALSPDGRFLAVVANNGGPDQLWVRAMDTLQSRALPGTDGATYPFWSPDGAYLGFFTEGKLRKIAVAGGPPQTLCDAAAGRGGAWNRDGVILFSPGPASAIFRVSAAGGIPVPATKLPGNGNSAAGNRFPVFLPDGIHFLYNAGSDKPDEAGVFIGALNGSAAVRLVPDNTNALYAPPIAPRGTAHILFRRENTLMAQSFDAKSLNTIGEIFPVAEQVPISVNVGFGAFSVSENGILAFRSGDATTARELIWMDRIGKRLGTASGKPGEFFQMNISPDEKTVALQIGDNSKSDIWLQDLERGVLSRFTFRPGVNRNAIWSSDGNRLVYAVQNLGAYSFDIYQKAAGGNGQEELLLHTGINGFPLDWSPDGKWIVYQQTDQKTGLDLWLLPLDGDRTPVPYLQTPFDEQNARFSPDGKWMVYQSNESGRSQIYVQSVPASGTKYQISASGGTVPKWRRDGKELFYMSADRKLMAVPMKLGATVEAGTPQALFPLPPTGNNIYAPLRDGQRFLVNVAAGGDAAAIQAITVVTNWERSLAPQGR